VSKFWKIFVLVLLFFIISVVLNNWLPWLRG
jgi:hypothetical protein